MHLNTEILKEFKLKKKVSMKEVDTKKRSPLKKEWEVFYSGSFVVTRPTQGEAKRFVRDMVIDMMRLDGEIP